MAGGKVGEIGTLAGQAIPMVYRRRVEDCLHLATTSSARVPGFKVFHRGKSTKMGFKRNSAALKARIRLRQGICRKMILENWGRRIIYWLFSVIHKRHLSNMPAFSLFAILGVMDYAWV
jgi:hypothetical protein